MNNIMIIGDGLKLMRFEMIILVFNGCFFFLFLLVICILNIVLILVIVKFFFCLKKLIDKIYNVFFYSNFMVSIMFLFYFGVIEILYGLEIILIIIYFLSYLMLMFFVFV